MSKHIHIHVTKDADLPSKEEIKSALNRLDFNLINKYRQALHRQASLPPGYQDLLDMLEEKWQER